MTQFVQDVLNWKDYDFVVINDDIEIVIEKLLIY